ncbi:FUSC family protein [Microbacterium sp. GXF7504]
MTAAIRQSLSATDPGRGRLKLAVAIATGMLLSALSAWAAVTFLHADPSLLTIGIFMAMQMGLTPHDATGRGRLVTTVLLIVPTGAAATLAVLLAEQRVLEIALLVCIAGIATWVRRYGPRATALGFGAFFGCFFPLLLKLTITDLPGFLLVAGGAVGSLALMRALLLVERPGRELALLLRELRDASAAALAAARHPDPKHPKTLRTRLARLDDVAQAITRWQQDNPTARYVDADETTFASLVLEARIDVEQACAELVRDAGHAPADPARSAALAALTTMLDNRASEVQVLAATDRARELFAALTPASPHRALVGRLTRSVLAHADLRDAVRRRPDPRSVPAATAPAPAPTGSTPASDTARWWDWRHWRLTTRLAVQVTIAAVIATGVGELISASRWYWAVLTAFIVFVGASTRGSILTRAYNRVAGTAAGLVVGVVLVLLVHESKPALVAICVVAAFGMMYFGPLLYLYSAFFITMLLVAMYGLIGVLDEQVLELRIGETLAGAVIGVLCAYLIFSANSRPSRLATVQAWFDALDRLLDTGRTALTGAGKDADVLAASQTLRAALADVDTLVSAMSVAMVGARRVQRGPVVHLLYVATRAAEGYAQAAIAVSTGRRAGVLRGDAATALDDALAHLRGLAASARRSFATEVAPGPGDTFILDQLPRVPFDALLPQVEAFVSLSRLAWALEHVVQENRVG